MPSRGPSEDYPNTSLALVEEPTATRLNKPRGRLTRLTPQNPSRIKAKPNDIAHLSPPPQDLPRDVSTQLLTGLSDNSA